MSGNSAGGSDGASKPRETDASVALYRQVRQAMGVVGQNPHPTTPRLAGVIALCRERAGQLEIYAVQRSERLAFLGGYWTFPGGTADPGEDDPRDIARRELREETGVVLPASVELREAGVWITPAFSPLRYETYYYLAPVDAAEPDYRKSGGELIDGTWITPRAARARYEAGDWLIPRPILRVIGLLEGGIDAAVSGVARELEAEHGSARYWDLTPALGRSPLRTPTLPPATSTNCYLVGQREFVIIDPASPYDDEQAELSRVLAERRAAGDVPVEIWLTHHHADHVGGAASLAEELGIGVAAHPATAERVAGRITVTRELADGDVRDLRGEVPRRLRAVFTPGHAPGHLCFYEEHSQFLVAGDMVAGIGTILVDPSEGDMGQYIESLKRMRALAPKRLLPAHGGCIVSADAKLSGYIQHRLWREARAAEAIGALPGETLAKLTERVYADVPAALHGLASRSLLSHIAKLVSERRVRAAGDGYELT